MNGEIDPCRSTGLGLYPRGSDGEARNAARTVIRQAARLGTRQDAVTVLDMLGLLDRVVT